MRKKSVVAAMRSQRAATLAVLSALDVWSWDRRTVGGASVRDVVARLVALEEGLVRGRCVLVVRRARTLDELARWCEARAIRHRNRAPDELLAALRSSGERVAAVVARLPGFAWRMRWRSPLGRQPLLHLLCCLVLVDWLAEQDILDSGQSGLDPVRAREGAGLDPVRAKALSVAVEATLPAVVLPRVERSAGVLRVVIETGGDTRHVFGVDFARKQYGPRITARPDAVIRIDAATFALTARGRTAWRETQHGTIRLDGDEDLAMGFLDALARAG